MSTNGTNALRLPGLITLTRLPDGTAIARVHSVSEWLTVRECCARGHCGQDLIYARVEDGTLAHRWKNHVGERGTILICATSFQTFLDARTHPGKLSASGHRRQIADGAGPVAPGRNARCSNV